MKNIMLLSVFFFAVSSVRAEVSFDQGIDVKSFIGEAVSMPVPASPVKSDQMIGATRDCKKVTFTLSEQLASDKIKLKSVETHRICDPGPVGPMCWERYIPYEALAQVVITQPRVLKPGQTEVFEVCLWGQFLGMNQISPAYKYTVKQAGDTFNLTPAKSFAEMVGAEKAGSCYLSNSDNYSCIYKCPDGSYTSRPNSPNPPGPWGPIIIPGNSCPGSVPFVGF